MIGLEAISAHNGWAMAITGAIIVMCGLSVLSFVISQLHKVIALFEKWKAPAPPLKKSPADIDILNDLGTAAGLYKTMTDDLGEEFHLSQLYRIFEREKQPHPHLTIQALRAAGYLVSAGEGIFRWQVE
jgi:hypothetical protein